LTAGKRAPPDARRLRASGTRRTPSPSDPRRQRALPPPFIEENDMGFADRQVAEIAASLPGATQVFRAHKIDFCCGGQVPLAEAAAKGGVPLPALEAELARLEGAVSDVPQDSAALIAHILTRYHETHRRELPELVRLAAKVEARHAGHPAVPRGLQQLLQDTAEALEEHMLKEEQVLFPLMQAGGHPMIHMPIGMMRHEHDEHGGRLAQLEALTHDCVAPPEACASWQALYVGLRKLVDDVREHVHLENNVLFPRFGA
jgi:regulator of cell morphogenesis and NO signaling